MTNGPRDLEAQTLCHLRRRLAPINELPILVEVQLLDRHFEDSLKEIVVARHVANDEERA